MSVIGIFRQLREGRKRRTARVLFTCDILRAIDKVILSTFCRRGVTNWRRSSSSKLT
jgi:hypothetical protein